MSKLPPPDHPEAYKLGCSCPRPANKLGDGVLVDGVLEYVVNPACPVHSPPRSWFASIDEYRPVA